MGLNNKFHNKMQLKIIHIRNDIADIIREYHTHERLINFSRKQKQIKKKKRRRIY